MAPIQPTRAQERRALATLALWAFVAGGVLSPALHLVTHKADHVHGVGAHTATPPRTNAQRVWVDHGAQAPVQDTSGGEDLPTEHPLQHGDGSALHLLMAFEDAAVWPSGAVALVSALQLVLLSPIGIRTVAAVWPPVLAQGPPASV